MHIVRRDIWVTRDFLLIFSMAQMYGKKKEMEFIVSGRDNAGIECAL